MEYGCMEYAMEHTTYSGDVELEHDSHDTANHCRVIHFNVGNFFLRGEKNGGKTNLCKQVSLKHCVARTMNDS